MYDYNDFDAPFSETPIMPWEGNPGERKDENEDD